MADLVGKFTKVFARKAKSHELDLIYSMGFDAWGRGVSMKEYLEGCHASKKYRSGVWYVLMSGINPVSSLIVYSNLFGLKENCFGIGSLATVPEFRQKGHGAQLVSLVRDELLNIHKASAIYLHSDINRKYYRKLGFTSIQDTDCMCISSDQSSFEAPMPSYF